MSERFDKLFKKASLLVTPDAAGVCCDILTEEMKRLHSGRSTPLLDAIVSADKKARKAGRDSAAAIAEILQRVGDDVKSDPSICRPRLLVALQSVPPAVLTEWTPIEVECA